MRTPEQVKQARIDLEYRRRQNAEMEIRDANLAAQLEEFQRETYRLERQADMEDEAWHARMKQKELRFKTVTIIVVSLLAYAIIIISNIASK